MKRIVNQCSWFASLVTGAVLAISSATCLAAPSDWFQGFDSAPGPWVVWWGVPHTPAWSSLDASNNLTSGSLQLSVPFVGANGEQLMDFAGFHWGWNWDGTTVLDGTLYTNFQFDLKVDPSTAVAVNGADYGTLDIGFVPPGWSSSATVHISNYTIPLTSTNWTHVTLPLNPTTAGLNSICAVYLKMWSNGHLTNTWTVNFDNMHLQLIPTNVPPPPPPTMSLAKTVSGLNLMTSGLGDANQRDSIVTATNLYSWVGASGPVTYAITMKQSSDTAHANFQTHLFLVPGAQTDNGSGTMVWTNMPWGPGDSAVDWNATNVIFIQLGNAANGGGNMRFMYKTNQGSGNTMIWNTEPTNGPVGTLATLNGQTPLQGIWTLTFNQNTSITMTAPNGASTNFSMPPEAAAIFGGPLYAYVGVQPNGAGNIGQSTILSRVQITGTPTELDDGFAGPGLDTNKWGVAAAFAPCVQVVTPEDKYWLTWTLPDNHFSPLSSPSIAPAAWTDLGLTNVIQLQQKQVLLSSSSLPSPDVGYFRMIKRAASKLQVLLPGETNAPGTVSGKIGTPDQQYAGTAFALTVNACDDTWHVIDYCADTVHFTSTDPAAYLPGDTALANGTVTIQYQTFFGSSGTWTITASDVTTNTVANGVSTAITIP